MRNGWPEEYSAWNITFHDWQIMRRRMTGSWAENCARRQSMVSTPFSSSSVRPSRMLLRSASMRRKNAPHEISEAGKRDQSDGQVEQIAGLHFGFASLFQNAAMQQFIERAGSGERIENAVQSVQPHWGLQFH